jgi:hypothetical protein
MGISEKSKVLRPPSWSTFFTSASHSWGTSRRAGYHSWGHLGATTGVTWPAAGYHYRGHSPGRYRGRSSQQPEQTCPKTSAWTGLLLERPGQAVVKSCLPLAIFCNLFPAASNLFPAGCQAVSRTGAGQQSIIIQITSFRNP